MGLPVVALVKLNLLGPSQNLSTILTGLVWPFVLNLSFTFRFVRGAHTDAFRASRLFFFQLGQIAFDAESAFGNNTRLERAIRLVYQRLTHARRLPAPLSDEDDFHTLSMVAL